MPIPQRVARVLLAYLAAAAAGYLVAIVFATSANLINLAAIGARIGIDDALRTYLALVDDVDGVPASGQILRITR